MEDLAQTSDGDEVEARTGRILVVDDQQPIRRWVRAILESDGHEVVTAESVKAGIEALKSAFDVGVFDVDLPDGKGFELVEFARQSQTVPLPVVMITGNPNEENLGGSVAHGITEFLFKPFVREELKEAVERALQAKARWERRVRSVSRTSRGEDPDAEPSGQVLEQGEVEKLLSGLSDKAGLTERERETLRLMLEGLQNADIARALAISQNTVKYHVRNVLTKLGMESRTELFRSLLRRTED